jgi:hypothetical protein
LKNLYFEIVTFLLQNDFIAQLELFYVFLIPKRAKHDLKLNSPLLSPLDEQRPSESLNNTSNTESMNKLFDILLPSEASLFELQYIEQLALTCEDSIANLLIRYII